MQKCHAGETVRILSSKEQHKIEWIDCSIAPNIQEKSEEQRGKSNISVETSY